MIFLRAPLQCIMHCFRSAWQLCIVKRRISLSDEYTYIESLLLHKLFGLCNTDYTNCFFMCNYLCILQKVSNFATIF